MTLIDNQTRLVEIANGNPRFISMLRAVRRLGLESWCIGAGAVRNLVWDAIHGREDQSPLGDVDVAYFDGVDLSSTRDAQLQAQLTAFMPSTPWEVTNQASVHHWFESYFGYAVPPLCSLEEAVASWPEYATAVGLRLHEDDTMQVIAPYGLDDLFGCIIRRNPARVSVETYRNRIEQKDYPARWPRVAIVLD